MTTETEAFKPRDKSFHLYVAAFCIGVALLDIVPALRGMSVGAGLLPAAVLVAVVGGINVGVIIESKRWEKVHPQQPATGDDHAA